jgi:hypothetical protein
MTIKEYEEPMDTAQVSPGSGNTKETRWAWRGYSIVLGCQATLESRCRPLPLICSQNSYTRILGYIRHEYILEEFT